MTRSPSSSNCSRTVSYGCLPLRRTLDRSIVMCFLGSRSRGPELRGQVPVWTVGQGPVWTVMPDRHRRVSPKLRLGKRPRYVLPYPDGPREPAHLRARPPNRLSRRSRGHRPPGDPAAAELTVSTHSAWPGTLSAWTNSG